MKTVSILIVGLAVVGLYAATQNVQQVSAAQTATEKHESPFACNRLALTPEQRHRHFDELGPALVKLRKDVHELADGYEFEFPSDNHTLQMLTEWMQGERLCCPFFDFDLRIGRESGPVWLRLTGRPGAKAFMQVDGAKWVQK